MRPAFSTHAFARAAVRTIGAVALAALAATSAAAQGAVATLAGGWSGSGRITYTDGSSEGIHCTAYYSGGGSDLTMAIQCKSDKNPIHIRSRLRISGSRASGEWEERTFNASGSASGTVSSSNISLHISGGGFSGSMTVNFSRSSHSVTISTEGIAMRRASISFSRR